MNTLQEKLFSLADADYRDFLSKLIPNIEKEKIIGVRISILRKFFKENKTLFDENFLKNLPHTFHEENLIHTFFINEEKNFEKCLDLSEKFFDFADNWAVSDAFNPKILQKNKDKIFEKIFLWLDSDKIYKKRAGMYFLMRNFLGKDFKIEILQKIAKIKSEDYYVNMMISWFFAESLAYNYDETILFLEEKNFDKFVQNKIISKARESRKISEEKKNYLKTLRS